MLQNINGSAQDLFWYVCTFYFAGHSHNDQCELVTHIKTSMSKLFEIYKPNPDAVVSENKTLPGLFFDVAIEPATDDGKPVAGWDVSVACDEPRSFFEEHRETITGAADFVRDCVGILVLEKFAKQIDAGRMLPAPQGATVGTAEAV